MRTPYGKGAGYHAVLPAFVDHGYAVVVQDVRGRYESEGAFQPLTQEPDDGDDTINWIARQPWSNGKVGMMGGSYVGIVQWKAALLNNPHLKAIFPVVCGYDDYRDRFYSTGGAMKLGNRLEWMAENMRDPGYRQDFGKYVLHLPTRTSDMAALGWTSPMYREVVGHPAFDAFWRAHRTREHLDRIKVPVFSVGGWYDNFVESDLEAFAALRAKGKREPDPDRSVGAQHVGAVRGSGFRSGIEGADPRTAGAVVRPVADGQGRSAAIETAGKSFRHGRESVARSQSSGHPKAQCRRAFTWRAAAGPTRWPATAG